MVNAEGQANWFIAIQTQIAKLTDQSERARAWNDCMLALHFRIVYFAYHRDEFGRLVLDGLARVPQSEHDKELIAAAFDERDAEQLSIDAVLAAAHLVAAAQSIHAACELLFRITYWALGLNTTVLSLTASNLTLQDVVKNAFGKSKTELEHLMQSSEYHYLNGFVAVNKFRHLLGPHPQLAYDESEKRGGMLIDSFEHGRGSKTHQYPSKWASDFLMADCESLVTKLHAIGVALSHDML